MTINDLKKDENNLVSKESKCLEDLQAFKRDKTFLDLLAISAGRKPIRAKTGAAAPTQEKTSKDSTFLTTVGGQPANKSKGPKAAK